MKNNTAKIMIAALIAIILVTVGLTTVTNSQTNEVNTVASKPLTIEDIPVSNDSLRVDYLFWLKCGGCYSIEPMVGDWFLNLEDNIDFNFTPVGWPNAIRDAEYFYIIKKLYEDGKLNKESFVNSIKDLFYITFQDNNVLNHLNTYKKLEKHKIFADFKEFETYVSNNKEYIQNGIVYSAEISSIYGINSVPSFVLDKESKTSLGDFNNDPIKMIKRIQALADQKTK